MAECHGDGPVTGAVSWRGGAGGAGLPSNGVRVLPDRPGVGGPGHARQLSRQVEPSARTCPSAYEADRPSGETASRAGGARARRRSRSCRHASRLHPSPSSLANCVNRGNRVPASAPCTRCGTPCTSMSAATGGRGVAAAAVWAVCLPAGSACAAVAVPATGLSLRSPPGGQRSFPACGRLPVPGFAGAVFVPARKTSCPPGSAGGAGPVLTALAARTAGRHFRRPDGLRRPLPEGRLHDH
jgi:hypothetical protein